MVEPEAAIVLTMQFKPWRVRPEPTLFFGDILNVELLKYFAFLFMNVVIHLLVGHIIHFCFRAMEGFCSIKITWVLSCLLQPDHFWGF